MRARIPASLSRILDLIEPDAVAGDLCEEYAEQVLPRVGPVRARLWLWREVLVTLAVGLARTAFHRVRRRPTPSDPNRGTPKREPMRSLMRDFRYGFRMLLKTPGLSLVAVLTIALGVGLTTHTFSVVYGTFLRGLPFEGAGRLVYLYEHRLADDIERDGVSIHDYVDWREQQTVFEDIAAYYQGTVNIADTEGRPERYDGAFLTANAFSPLGVQPVLGRAFAKGEDAPNAPPTILLGYHVWQNRYGGDPAIIGKSLRANGRTHTVIGVMPQDFRFPFMEDVWLPLEVDPLATERGEGVELGVYGRLKEGVSLDEAQTQLTSIAQRLAMEYPESNEGVGATVLPWMEADMPAEIRAVMWLMLAAVFGVLLIACANVANLLLARAAVRSKEVAIRSALGASRSRVIRQLLVEATAIALVGGAVGIGLSYVGIDVFNAGIVDITKPFYVDIRLDPVSIVFAVAVTLLASVVSGTIPAFKASGADVNEILKDESKGSSSFRMSRFSTGLVIGEIAMSCALLVAAGLMVKSVINVQNLDMGVETEDVFTARVGLFESDYPDDESRWQFYDRLVQRLEALPAARAVALTSNLPGVGTGWDWIAIEGEAYGTDRDYPRARRAVITPGYFETFGSAPIAGRALTAGDRADALPVAIVNQSFAERFYPDASPLGRRLRTGRSDSDNPWRTIVGVVPDYWIGVGGVGGMGGDQNEVPELFFTPLAQETDRRFISMAVKTAGDPMAIAPAVRDAVTSIDPNLPIYWVDSMEKVIADNTWAFGLFGTLFTIFGVIALFMAAVGLYGVMAFSVSRRTQEMGIRIALGAYGKDIMGLVLKKGFLQLGAGLAIGLGLGVALSQPLKVVLFGVNSGDLSVYAAIAATLAIVGLLACFVPARRATRVDVVDALKPE